MSNVTLVPGSPEWGRTITASKVGAIMGASKYASPTSVWHELAGLVEHDMRPQSDAQFRGTMMEPYVLAWAWERRHPDWLREAGETTWTRDDIGFPAAANTDSHGLKDNGAPVIIEAKAVGYNSPLDQWGEEGTDQVPLDYYYQLVFQMLMSGIHEARIERCGPSVDEHKEYVVVYDPTIGAALQQRLTDFYNSVLMGTPPEPDGHEATLVTYKRAYRDVDDSEWEIDPKLADALDAARADEENATARKREATSRILHAMGEAKFATVDGERRFRRQRSGKGIALHPVKQASAGEIAA